MAPTHDSINRARRPGGQDRREGPPRGHSHGQQGRGSGDHGGGSPKAAVPFYVGTNFSDAPPGHKYLLYLPFWQNDWSTISSGKQRALSSLCNLPPHTKEIMQHLAFRQKEYGEKMGAAVIQAESISPFATGLGWEHPNENGFAFLHPYGLPYLAGSGIKGVVRRAAQDLAKAPGEENRGWTESAITELFGLEPPPGSEDANRGALRFFDAIPILAEDKMAIDIMNPHYGEYYKGNTTPHDAGQPIPIFFLVVPPGSKFTFVVDCPREHMLSEELKKNWHDLIKKAFEHAFEWLGFGAKTAVGYGQFGKVNEAACVQVGQVERAATVQNHAHKSISAAQETIVWDKAALDWNPSNKKLTATYQGQKAIAKTLEIIDRLDPELRKRLLSGRHTITAKVTVEKDGNRLMITKIE